MTPTRDACDLEQLRRENLAFRERLQIAENTLQAIQRGEVEALVAHTPKGIRILPLPEAERLEWLASFPKLRPEPTLDCTAEGEITFANDAARTIAQQSRLSDIRDIMPAGWRAIVAECLARDQRRGPLESTVGEHTFLWTFVPVKNSGSVHVYGTEITDRKKAEEALRASEERHRRLNLTLDGQVKARTAELEASTKEMEAFAYSVSHDLRAPLRAIDGFSQILIKEYLEILPEKPRHYLEMVCENARQMGRLIDDILRLSRLDRQSITMEAVDTAFLVRECLKELEPDRDGRQVAFQIGDLPPCWGSANLLKQVWMNLVANAQKFTRKRDAACIEIGATVLDGETTYFVKDNGVGFDMRYADKLFGVFQRLHPMEEYEGTGIGLALVKRIVQRHGGRLWAEAAVDQGATFYFTLARRPDHV